jgi:ribosomal protein S18 acetylase RimI-like enzyme
MVMSTRKNTLEIRTITPDDKYDILDVYRRCEDFLALGPEPKASLAMVLKDIETIRHEGGVFQGIYVDDRMVGVVSYVVGGFEGKQQVAFISLLMIAASSRGHGIGTEIVRRIEKEILMDSKVTTVLSAVQVNNPDALRFWEKNGYQITGGPELRSDKTTVFHLCKELKPVTQVK